MLALAQAGGSDPATGDYHHYATDHLGTTRALFDANQDRVATGETSPYGTKRTGAGAMPGRTYTGKPYDPATGLYYFPYRYYSPQSNRWLTRDPLGMVDGPNVYAYVMNRPTMHAGALVLFVSCPVA